MQRSEPSVPQRSRRTLERGALLYRWVALAWMTVVASLAHEEFRNAPLAWASIGAAAGWTVWLTVGGGRERSAVLTFDLALSFWLSVVSGLVAPRGELADGRAFFAAGYPISTVALWGAERRIAWGIAAGAVLGAAYALSRPVNGTPFHELPGPEVQSILGTILNYTAAGGAIGFVARLLDRSAVAVQEATDELVRERERAARLAERESLARQIHDSVLQALALVHKRGRELAAAGEVPPSEMARLAEIAGAQESQLRTLVMRAPEEPPTGRASLRSALEEAARSVEGVSASVSAVGPIWLQRGRVEEIAAAVRQALDNVAKHARATHAQVFADQEDDGVIVSVRDDGIGFEYDEEALSAAGRAGILRSMKGRIEDLGGRMNVYTGPGKGTEVEFVVPMSEEEGPPPRDAAAPSR